MAGFSNYTENGVLNLIFGAQAFGAPATLSVGLHVGGTAPDMEAGTGVVEPSVGAYARVAVTNNTTNFPATANGSKSNGQPITFPKATADWGTATHFVIYDGTNIIAIGALTPGKLISNGDTASFAAQSLVITLD